MVASTDIKWFTSDNLNAPQLTNDWGVLIGVLDACLINGFSVQSVASLTATGAMATATFNTAHQYKQYQVIEINGAAQPEYNVQARILTVPNANSITFELAAAPSVATATGTITCKLPALDWEKPFGNTGQKAAYRSKNMLLPSRPFLRVDNGLDPAYTTTYAKYAKVGIVENMTDIDTMQGVQAPYDSTNPNKNWAGTGSGSTVINGWAKWYYARSVALDNSGGGDNSLPIAGNRPFIIVGNKDFFYILNGHAQTDKNKLIYGFGSLDSSDRAFFLSATLNYATAGAAERPGQFTPFGASNIATGCLIRKVSGEAFAMQAAKGLGLGVSTTISSGASNYVDASNALASDIFCIDPLNMFRDRLPAVKWLYNTKPYTNAATFADGLTMYKVIDIMSYTLNGQILIKIGELS